MKIVNVVMIQVLDLMQKKQIVISDKVTECYTWGYYQVAFQTCVPQI